MISLYGRNKTRVRKRVFACPECDCTDLRLEKKRSTDHWHAGWSDQEYSFFKSEREIVSCFHCYWWKYTSQAKSDLIKEVSLCPDILIPREGSMCLYLPFETCIHSTEMCRVACLAKKEKHPSDLQRNEVLRILVTTPIDVICNKILQQIVDDNSVMHWFGSGDCGEERDYLSSVLTELLGFLAHADIPQCGFTRSPVFLKAIYYAKSDSNKCRIFFTVEKFWEDSEDIPSRSNVEDHYGFGWTEDIDLMAVPDYDHNMTELYGELPTGEKYFSGGGCGTSGSWHWVRRYESFVKEQIPQDCKQCFDKGVGCFLNIPEEAEE